jgi:cell division protein FtsQ
MTTRARALVVAAMAALAVGGWIGTPRLMRRLDYFRVRQVEVRGLRFLDEREIVERLALPRTASIADPIGPLQLRAVQIPGVAGASVERRLPGTLRVLILEETPVALTMQEDRLVLLDRRGKVLPFDPSRAPASFPVADRDSATVALLSALLRADPEWYAIVERARRDGGDVLLEDGAQRVRVRPDASLETLRAITKVRAYLRGVDRPWRELDARFADRVFVKGGAS